MNINIPPRCKHAGKAAEPVKNGNGYGYRCPDCGGYLVTGKRTPEAAEKELAVAMRITRAFYAGKIALCGSGAILARSAS